MSAISLLAAIVMRILRQRSYLLDFLMWTAIVWWPGVVYAHRMPEFQGNINLAKKPVIWDIAGTSEHFTPDGHYQLGAILHHGHPYSIRKRSWQNIPYGTDNNRTIEFEVVPYVEDQSGQRCYVVPDLSRQPFQQYILACDQQQQQVFWQSPDLYPTLWLNTFLKDDSNLQEQAKNALRDNLHQWLLQQTATYTMSSNVMLELDIPTSVLGMLAWLGIGYQDQRQIWIAASTLTLPEIIPYRDMILSKAIPNSITPMPEILPAANKSVVTIEGKPKRWEAKVADQKLSTMGDLLTVIFKPGRMAVLDGWSYPEVVGIEVWFAGSKTELIWTVPLAYNVPPSTVLPQTHVQEKEQNVRFSVRLPQGLEIGYLIDNDQRAPVTSTEFSLEFPQSALPKTITFSVPDVPACNISHKFTIQEIDTVITIEPTCIFNTIVWDSLWGIVALPQAQDCLNEAQIDTIQKMGKSRITCLRKKNTDLHLEWPRRNANAILRAVELNSITDRPYYVSEMELIKEPQPDQTEPAIHSSQPQTHTVRWILPDVFKSLNLTNKITLGNSPVTCSAPGQTRICSVTVPANVLPKELKIDGLKPIPVVLNAADATQEITLDPASMEAVFRIKPPQQQGITYTVDIRNNARTMPVSIPQTGYQLSFALNSLPTPNVSFYIQGDQNNHCTILHTFTIEEALQNTPIELPPTCMLNTITWPQAWEPPVEASSCAVLNKAEQQWQCLWKPESDLIVSWGAGWEPVTIKPTDWDNAQKYQVTLAEMRPRWPLQANDPWLKPSDAFVGIANPCEAGPGYWPGQITLISCLDAACRRAIDKMMTLQANRSGQLPTLQEMQWYPKAPLPSIGNLFVERTSPNASHPSRRVISWFLKDGFNHSLEDSSQSVAEQPGNQEFPVQVEPDDVPFEPGAKLVLCQSLQECQTTEVQTLQKHSTDYTAYDTEQLKASFCSWAMVVKNGLRRSLPARAQLQDDHIVFRIQSNRLPGKRTILMVANSRRLAVDGRGKAIKEALFNYLVEAKNQGGKPMDLFVADDNYMLSHILQGEDLTNFVPESTSQMSIRGMLSRFIRFDQDGLQPLRNLDLLVKSIHDAPLSTIVFFTESDYLPTSKKDPQFTNLLLNWERSGVKLVIITSSSSSCDFWQRNNVATCHVLPDFPDSTMIHLLLKEIAQ